MYLGLYAPGRNGRRAEGAAVPRRVRVRWSRCQAGVRRHRQSDGRRTREESYEENRENELFLVNAGRTDTNWEVVNDELAAAG